MMRFAGEVEGGVDSPGRSTSLPIPLRHTLKPVVFPGDFEKQIASEFGMRYLSKIGVTPTVKNCRALLKKMPLESCRVTAAWRSRGCPDDAVIIQPRGRGSRCDASGNSGGQLGVAKEGRRKEEIGNKIGSGLLVSPLELTLQSAPKLTADVGEWDRSNSPKPEVISDAAGPPLHASRGSQNSNVPGASKRVGAPPERRRAWAKPSMVNIFVGEIGSSTIGEESHADGAHKFATLGQNNRESDWRKSDKPHCGVYTRSPSMTATTRGPWGSDHPRLRSQGEQQQWQRQHPQQRQKATTSFTHDETEVEKRTTSRRSREELYRVRPASAGIWTVLRSIAYCKKSGEGIEGEDLCGGDIDSQVEAAAVARAEARLELLKPPKVDMAAIAAAQSAFAESFPFSEYGGMFSEVSVRSSLKDIMMSGGLARLIGKLEHTGELKCAQRDPSAISAAFTLPFWVILRPYALAREERDRVYLRRAMKEFGSMGETIKKSPQFERRAENNSKLLAPGPAVCRSSAGTTTPTREKPNTAANAPGKGGGLEKPCEGERGRITVATVPPVTTCRVEGRAPGDTTLQDTAFRNKQAAPQGNRSLVPRKAWEVGTGSGGAAVDGDHDVRIQLQNEAAVRESSSDLGPSIKALTASTPREKDFGMELTREEFEALVVAVVEAWSTLRVSLGLSCYARVVRLPIAVAVIRDGVETVLCNHYPFLTNGGSQGSRLLTAVHEEVISTFIPRFYYEGRFTQFAEVEEGRIRRQQQQQRQQQRQQTTRLVKKSKEDMNVFGRNTRCSREKNRLGYMKRSGEAFSATSAILQFALPMPYSSETRRMITGRARARPISGDTHTSFPSRPDTAPSRFHSSNKCCFPTSPSRPKTARTFHNNNKITTTTNNTGPAQSALGSKSTATNKNITSIIKNREFVGSLFSSSTTGTNIAGAVHSSDVGQQDEVARGLTPVAKWGAAAGVSPAGKARLYRGYCEERIRHYERDIKRQGREETLARIKLLMR